MKKPVVCLLCAALVLIGTRAAQAHPPTVSEASALSALPVAISVAAPASVLVAGAALTVVSVAAVAQGTLIVLERASDGARVSLIVGSQIGAGLSFAAGTAVVVTSMAAGWLISAAGTVIAFVPNELGRALLYNERVL